MTKPNLTEIVVILDCSGSMAGLAQEMTQGLKSFIEKAKQAPGECNVTYVTFSTGVFPQYHAKPIADVTEMRCVPSLLTALQQAVGETIEAVGKRLGETPEDERPSKVQVVVVTDGLENASQGRWAGVEGAAEVRRLVTQQEEQYAWEFVFLGANMDAFEVGGSMGFTSGSAMCYQPSAAGVKGAFDSVAAKSYASRCCGTKMSFNAADYEAQTSAGLSVDQEALRKMSEEKYGK
jgi:uncharacterized protein YegL